MVKPIKVTKENFYYKFPSTKWFILRKLDNKWTHYYPSKDGQLPKGFLSKSAANKDITRKEAIFGKGDSKIVSGVQASKYPVPKRY